MPLPFVAALSPKLARFASGAFFKVGFFAQGVPESLELENDIPYRRVSPLEKKSRCA